MLRFLPGILIIQIATVALALAAVRTSDSEQWIAIACLAVIVNLVTTFWFGSIAGHMKKDAVARAKEEFYRERETLKVNAERQKSRLIKKSHEQINKETNRAHAKANFKVGAAFAGVIGAGALMMFTQFLTLGLLTLAGGGGALAGYLVRVRQEYKSGDKVSVLPSVSSAGKQQSLPPPQANKKGRMLKRQEQKTSPAAEN